MILQLSTFAVTMSDKVKLHLMTRLWKRVLDILISTLIPPLSDKETSADPLTTQEINVVFQWLKVSLSAFFMRYFLIDLIGDCVTTATEELLQRVRKRN